MNITPNSHKVLPQKGVKSSAAGALHRAAFWIANNELWILIIASPTLLFPGRWTFIGLAVILLIWLSRWIATGSLTVRSLMDIPIFVLLVMTVIGYWVSVDVSLSSAKLWGIILQIAFFYSVLNSLRDQKSVLGLTRLMVIGLIALAIFALVGTDWSSVRLFDYPEIYGGIPSFVRGLPGSGVAPQQELFHPRQVGATIAMLLPLAIVWLVINQSWGDRILAIAALFTGGLVLLLSQALMGFFGLLLALILLAVWWRRWLLLPIFAGLTILIIAIFINGPQRLALALLDINNPVGIAAVLRIDMWSRALAMIHDFPFTGIGLNTFPLIQSHFYIGHLLGPEVHAHNLFLQTALDLGIPGLLAFLLLLTAFTITVIRAYKAESNREIRVLLAGLAACVLAYLGGGLLDTVTLGAKPVAALWIIFGIAAALYVQTKGKEAPTSNPRRSAFRWLLYLTPLILLLLSILLLPSVWRRNLGIYSAQKAIYTARVTGDLPETSKKTVLSRLQQAIEVDPDDPELYGLLGTVQAWSGANDLALDAFRKRIALDERNALGRYAPFIKWQLQLAGDPLPDGSDQLIQVYNPWQIRFPDRAEGYVLSALVLSEGKQNYSQAAAALQSGLDAGASPEDLLQSTLNQLIGSE